LSERTGKSFVVENMAGAGGNIGMGAAAKAQPNGHTLLLASSTYGVNPSLYKSVPYDPLKDFAPISMVGESPLWPPSLQRRAGEGLRAAAHPSASALFARPATGGLYLRPQRPCPGL